jgi:hypothetical protein
VTPLLPLCFELGIAAPGGLLVWAGAFMRYRGHARPERVFWAGLALFAAGTAAALAAEILTGRWPLAAESGVTLLVTVWLVWHFWWRKRKRALRALGGKARARLAAMLAALKERTLPRRAPRPAPGGAR